MMPIAIFSTTRQLSRLWGQAVIFVLIMTIIGSLLVYVYAHRRYTHLIENDYQIHRNTLQEIQQNLIQFYEEYVSIDSSRKLDNERIQQQLLTFTEKSSHLFRVSILDAHGNIIFGKEAKSITKYFQAISSSFNQKVASIPPPAANMPAFQEHVHLVQLPLIIHRQHIGFLRGEFLPINSGTALIQVTKITLQIIIIATGLMIVSGVILIFTQITRHLSSKQQRLEEYALSLERANENLRRAKRELQISEKLASLGYLAAGIAHEIGNPLGSVLGYIELLQKNIIDREKAQDILQRIEKDIERIRGIIQELISFSRPRTMKIQRVDVNKIVRTVISQIPSDPEKAVEINPQLTEFPLFADVDKHKLQSVFFNIIYNGIDAISASGTIQISTSRRIRESADIIGGSEVIAIQFSDNGSGIPEEELPKVFDPFFTTKEPGHGMGLGLSLCHRIIESLNGEIEIQSTYGKGTDVTVYLPPARKKE